MNHLANTLLSLLLLLCACRAPTPSQTYTADAGALQRDGGALDSDAGDVLSPSRSLPTRTTVPAADPSPCAVDHPDGACAPDALCVAGTCVVRCSIDAPHGACEDGAICANGACDPALCRTLSTSEECVLCMEDNDCDALLACWDDALGGYWDCWYCAVEDAGGSACDCRATRAACAGCDHLPFFACVERNCPAC